jgi:pimeloyl-ACP methyl ester carboxylesterase
MRFRTKAWAGAIVAIVVTGLAVVYAQLPAIGAGGLLHPVRQVTSLPAPSSCFATDFAGEEVTLRGWRCRSTAGAFRGTIIYLHGIGDNRGSATGVIERFTRRGFDVIAYDSRAHGESGGNACTYGVLEKRDLRKVVDTLSAGPIALIGTSLGAAVALQEAADDPRVTAVVAAEIFSDLRTVATERAPFFFSGAVIERAFELAEQRANLAVDAASPVAAASRVTARVLLIHGAADIDTPPSHSQRVYEALRGPKRLLLVPAAGHNASLRGDVWHEIERWLQLSHSPRGE